MGGGAVVYIWGLICMSGTYFSAHYSHVNSTCALATPTSLTRSINIWHAKKQSLHSALVALRAGSVNITLQYVSDMEQTEI